MLNPTVTIVRVLSMFLILITHFLSWKNVNSFQISTVGVSAFLFISGYLYGSRDIENKIRWFCQRIKRVLVPFWILSFLLSIFILLNDGFLLSVKNFVETLLNLQGIHFLIRIPFKLGNYHIAGLGHCWFLTVIMLCYFFVAAIKNSKFEYLINSHLTISFFILLLLHFTLSFFNISIGTIVVFFIGYFFKKYEDRKSSFKPILVFLVVFLSFVFFILRVFLKHYIDDTPFYDLFIASLASNACSISFFLIIRQICALDNSLFNTFVSSKIWRKIDTYSYPIFLTHYMFLKGPFVINHTYCILIQTSYFLLLTIITAIFLNVISNFFNEKIVPLLFGKFHLINQNDCGKH